MEAEAIVRAGVGGDYHCRVRERFSIQGLEGREDALPFGNRLAISVIGPAL